MRVFGLLAAAATLALSCTPSTSASPAASAARVASTLAAFSPQVGLYGTVGWDGVDNRVMLVTPVDHADVHHVTIAVWTLSGASWQPLPGPALAVEEPGFGPFGFGPFVLAYDSARHVEVLIATPTAFPGQAVVNEWNGHVWHLVVTAHAPQSFRVGAYSPELHGVVGRGFHDNDRSATTWIYDGTDWRSIAPWPSAFSLETLAYDPTRHAVLGLDSSSYWTWQFDGSTWTSTPVGDHGPREVTGYYLGYNTATLDPQHGQWIVFGGGGDAGNDVTSDTWVGVGASWTRASPPLSPPPRRQYQGSHLAWDPLHARAVLFGGCCDLPLVGLTDTWAWNGKTWTKLSGAAPVAIEAPLPSPPPCIAASSYGLLIASGRLELVDTCGKVASSASISPASVSTCTAGGDSAVQPPPVSATSDRVFFRDGDTAIRSLTPDGQTESVTTVPGGPNVVSFFSVSPDDQRIAVVVEDLSSAAGISIRLYVEDLRGGGHHIDVFSTSQPKAGGTTLWPMGWHQGQLVLASMTACSADPTSLSPIEWHAANASTGVRAATITRNCNAYGIQGPLSRWPTPAGVVCPSDPGICTYDWSGKQTSCWSSFGLGCAADWRSGLSPSGRQLFVSGAPQGCNGGTYKTRMFTLSESGVGVRYTTYDACLWIDDSHLLGPNAVIESPPTQWGSPSFADQFKLTNPGTCAGRFPGGL
ncbi:MAG: hypothetical protein ACREOM_01755 [Candidatus Dormibacteraceae bacterium]